MKYLLFYILALGLFINSGVSAAVNVQQQSNGQYYTRVYGTGSSSLRYDIVVLGDGFTATEQDDFNDRTADIVYALQGRAPYSKKMCAFNIWRVNVVSQESGVDHPKDGEFKNTELDVRYGDPADNEAERCIKSDSPAKIWEAAGYAPEYDTVFVLANDKQHGGCAGSIVFSSISSGFANTVTHELGHKIQNLADEYNCYFCDGSDSGQTYAGGEPFKVNCTIGTTMPTIKWSDLIDPSTPLPTTVDNPAGVVGAWEGCLYNAYGIYRPQRTCHMRSSNAPFCMVCDRELERGLAAHCTACENADTPKAKLLACTRIMTKPPWWYIANLRWQIPLCLNCPPYDFLDPLVIVIRELGTERGVTARIVDDTGRILATERQTDKGLSISFTANRGGAYWLELDYPQATLLKKALQPEVFRAGKRVAGP